MRAGIKILLALVLIGASVLIVRGVRRSDRELHVHKDRPVAAQPASSVPSPSCPPAAAAVETEGLQSPDRRPDTRMDDTQALQAAIRQIVREELQASRQTEGRPAGLPQRAAAPPTPSAESHEALQKTRSLVHNALSTRYWGAEQSTAMSELLPKLTPEQRDEVFRELVPALNNGDIEMAAAGMPF